MMRHQQVALGLESTHRSDGLNANGKHIRRQVTRVRKRIFLPQLAKDGLQLRDVGAVVQIIP